MLRSLFAGAVASGVFVIACSSGGGSVSSGACQHVYNSLIAYYSRCGLSSTFFPSDQLDRASKGCEAQLSAPGSATSSSDLDACASQIDSIPCNSNKALDSLTSCTKPGTTPVGGPCSSGIQCQSTQCSSTNTDTCGTCVATAKEGEMCDSNKTRCVQPLVCTGQTGTCAKRTYNPAGAPCDSFAQQCDDGLRCDYTTKKCVAYVMSGGACTTTTDCNSNLVCSAMKCIDPPGEGGDCSMSLRCAKDLACDYSGTKTCVKLTYAKGGEACSSVKPCAATLSCPTTKVCPMVIPDGGACNAMDMTQTCDYAARCIDGKCGFGLPTCK